MRIMLLSDLHLEFHCDTVEFVSKLDSDVDVLVLAGDINVHDQIIVTLDLFCNKFKNVVYVPGNHEYYHTSPKKLKAIRKKCHKRNDNLHWLDNEIVTIKGQRFLGGTGWFRDHPTNFPYERNMSDFNVIQDFKPWVYEEQAKFELLLENNLQVGDVVVTHHLPSEVCIDDFFKGSFLNRFFVCDYSNLIYDRGPALWMYGHTHFEQDLSVGDTRLVCNPRGYPNERNPFDPADNKEKIYKQKIIEV